MLNIFFDGSTEGTAHSCKTQLGLEGETMMSLELFLHAGNISVPMSVRSRIKVYDAYFDGFFGIVSEEIRRLKKYLKKENSVCIWFSKKDADEYLGMLAFTNYRLYQLLESGKLILVKQGVVQQGIYGWAKEFFKSIVKISN